MGYWIVIYLQIIRNKPNIDQLYAERVARATEVSCRKWEIPCNVYTAILMQESTYRLDSINCQEHPTNNQVVMCHDYGIAQVNNYSISKLSLDRIRLLYDLEYSIDAGARILSWFHKTYSDTEPTEWWSRYNCGTGPIDEACIKYKQLTERWL